MSDAHQLLADAMRLLANSLNDVVPTEAQLHLLNAQREMMLALAVIIEHNSTRSVRSPRAKAKTSEAKAKARSDRRPKRVAID